MSLSCSRFDWSHGIYVICILMHIAADKGQFTKYILKLENMMSRFLFPRIILAVIA